MSIRELWNKQADEYNQFDSLDVEEVESFANSIIEKVIDEYKEAIEDVVHWGSYASEYFKNKYNLEGNIKEMRDFLEWLEAQK